jgi:hypothetical protein
MSSDVMRCHFDDVYGWSECADAGDLARSHRDDLVCVETVFIVQEAHVQMVQRLSNVIIGDLTISFVCANDVCCRSSECHNYKL